MNIEFKLNGSIVRTFDSVDAAKAAGFHAIHYDGVYRKIGTDFSTIVAASMPLPAETPLPTDAPKINVTESAGKIYVELPYELKDAFRAAFKSAKFNSGRKSWELTTRSRSRVAAWVAEVEASGVLEELRDKSDLELEEREIDDLHRRIDKIKQDISTEEDRRAALIRLRDRKLEMKRELADLKPVLDIAAAERAQAGKEAAAAAAAILAEVGRHINLDAQKKAISTVIRQAKTQTSYSRSQFEAAQLVIESQLEDLARIGIASPELSTLAYVKFNNAYRRFDELRSAADAVTYRRAA